LREGRASTQRHGIRVACESAAKHYQAIAQASGALANLISDMTRATDEEPAAVLTRIQEAVNRSDDDVLGEVRKQLLVACAEAMDLNVVDEKQEQRPPPPPKVEARQPDEVNNIEFTEQLRRAYQR
jgi:hypothetical protein